MFKLILAIGWGFFFLVTLILGLLTFAGFFGQKWWGLELTSHFRVQYFILLAGISLLFAVGGKKLFTLVSLVFMLINLGFILPFYLSTQSVQASGNTYRFLHANLLKRNTSYDKVRQLIDTVDPDIILFVEVTEAWMEELSPVLENYPYQTVEIQGNNFGFALLSRIPMDQGGPYSLGDTLRPMMLGDFSLDGKKLRVIGMHPPPPTEEAKAGDQHEQISQIAQFVEEQENDVILAGDFNMTSWSPTFSKLLESGLRDSRIGFGVQPSWPTSNRLMMIPIDHILVTGGIIVHNRQMGPDIGSDHLPVIMDFSFR